MRIENSVTIFKRSYSGGKSQSMSDLCVERRVLVKNERPPGDACMQVVISNPTKGFYVISNIHQEHAQPFQFNVQSTQIMLRPALRPLIRPKIPSKWRCQPVVGRRHRSYMAPPFLLDDYIPRFQLLSSADAAKKRSLAYKHLKNCNLCPRLCGVNRFEKTGTCLIGADVKVNTIAPHFGEGIMSNHLHGRRSTMLRYLRV